MTLLEKTLQLLNKEDVDLFDAKAVTGLGYHWLVSLKRGSIKDPGVDKIQTLYEYLSGKKIKL